MFLIIFYNLSFKVLLHNARGEENKKSQQKDLI